MPDVVGNPENKSSPDAAEILKDAVNHILKTTGIIKKKKILSYCLHQNFVSKIS